MLAALNPASAAFPERTVKIVVPFEAGGTLDVVARALADRLKAEWQVPVIVENRPGAGNIIGATVTGATPAETIATVNAAVNDVVGEREFNRRSLPFCCDMRGDSVADFARFLDQDIERYAALIKTLGGPID